MLTKLSKITVAALLAVSSSFAPVSDVFAQETSTGKAVATVSGNKVTIGNNAIEREFDFTNNKLTTTKINNKLGNKVFNPAQGSEEFIIQLLNDSKVTFHEPSKALTSVKPTAQTSTVSVKVSSTTTEAGVAANNILDGKANTHWASAENPSQAKGSQWVEVDFGSAQAVKTVKYTPRWDNGAKYNCTGRVNEYKLETWDGEKFVQAATGTFTVDGTTAKEQGTSTITLSEAVTTSKIRFTGVDTYFWDGSLSGKVMNVAELDVLDESNASLVHKKASANWTLEGTSNSTNPGDNGGYAALIDGNASTYYHSRYNEAGTGTTNTLPVDLTLDRGNNTPFNTFGYLPRPNATVANGDFLEYEIYVSDEKANLYTASNKKLTSKFVYDDAFANGAPKYLYASFDQEQTGRYVGVRVLKGYGGNFASGAEINLYKEKFDTFSKEELYPSEAGTIATSKLELAKTPEVSTVTPNGKEIKKPGTAVTFTFKPYKGIEIVERVVMYDGDHFMRKLFEINIENKKQRINYIDGEHLVLNDTDDRWTIPHVGGVVQMEEFKANLGQPIYVDGLFLGSEFPASQTEVLENVGFTRYYTGKNFEDFARDGQLTTDGKFITWQTVVGASPAADTKGNNLDIVKQSFFNYIDSIATPSDFRIQYNSWFDNMMRITDENILSSFSAVDKHLSETGVRPLDSYVVDDGWNIYRKTAGTMNGGIDIERNGPVDEVNTAGFWQFNSKFPKGLTPSSELVQNFGSNFGVWIGPRGGYNYQGTLADIIQTGITVDGKKVQYGSSAGGSIDVADQRYVDKFEEMAIQWMEDYKVNYWKWDGFADYGQYNAFRSGEGVVGYDENHHHMYGGPHHMYHVTDLWEKWIDLMTNVRNKANELNINNLWISLTCYVNPSPWYLQWANSVWIQCVADRGERTNNNAALNNKMDNMLSYRDGCYYDFVVKHKFQFPLANLYNHDPIYGTEGTGITASSMDAEQFRNYMFMQGTRGTAFWELYYSDSIFNDEKYLINADFLEWAEENFDLLRNAIMVGGTPSSTATLDGNPTGAAGNQEAYGFAGFNLEGTEGTISMRNPAATEKTISFKLDEAIGVKTTKGTTYHVTKDHAYVTKNTVSKAVIPATVNQGDTITVTLQPGETYVLHFNTQADTKAPVVNKLYIKDANTVQVKASEHVNNAAFTVTVDGKEVEASVAKAYGDLRTYNVTLAQPLTKGASVKVAAKAGKDDANNALVGEVTLNYYPNSEVVAANNVSGNKVVSTAANSIKGSNGFSVTANVETTANNVVLVSQGSDYKLGIDANGKAYFELNGTRATSNKAVNTGSVSSITGVKENNGIIKVYVNGHVSKSAYNVANKDFAVTAADINATNVQEVKVYNRALGYDEVPTLPTETLLRDFIAQVESEQGLFTSASWEAQQVNTILEEAKTALNEGKEAEYQAKYDALVAAYEALIPDTASKNLALRKPVTSGWLNNGYNGDGTDSGRPLNVAVDGAKNNKDNYSIFGHVTGGQTTKPSYMQVDLGSESAINKVQLYRYFDNRTYNSTAVVVSNTPDFKEFEVLYYSGTEDVFGLNATPNQPLYAETSAGRTLFDNASKPVTGRYVRVYGNGVQGNNQSENHIVELEVYGTVADAYNIKDLEAKVNEAKELASDTARYTAAQLAKLNAEITKAENVVKAVKAGTQEDKTIGYVINTKEALQAAIDELANAVVAFGGVSATLTDKISMNVYVKADAEVIADENAYVSFTMNGKEVKVPAAQLETVKTGLYKASLPLFAKQMSDVVTINVFTTKANGEVTADLTKDYSIKAYGDAILASTSNSKEEKAIAEAMLNYGATAQTYFKYNVENLANANVTNKPYEKVTAQELVDYTADIKENNVKGATYGATNLRLLSETSIRHHFIVDMNEKANLKFYVVKGDVEEEVTPVYYGGNKAYVEVSNIYAESLDKAYTVKVVNTTAPETVTTVTYSAFSYAKAILEKEDASKEMKDVVKAIVEYNRKANAYKESIRGQEGTELV